MSRSDRRKYRRLALKLDISCRKVGCPRHKPHVGCTGNVSPGGLYFETVEASFRPGDLLTVELSIPPTVGLLEFGGKIAGVGNVLRTHKTKLASEFSSDRYGVALEFCRSPKLCS